ncbi:hypothetical protein [Enterococcus sp. UD-01]|uniref:hypothetical protein n=1 Tax=Enterococcus sp. UD-01 TaxID=3373911 RepID=UPI0038387DD1
MKFKNVILTKKGAGKWANYFAEKYPTKAGFVGRWTTWSGLTINEDQSVFVKHKCDNPDKPTQVWLYYFWHGYLFNIQMKQIWEKQELKAWEVDWINPYPEQLSSKSIHLPQKLKKKRKIIFRDLRQALIVYGVDGSKVANPPLPNIKIRLEKEVYESNV